MKKYTQFTFESYHFDISTLQAHFFYSFDNGDVVFEENIDFSCDGFILSKERGSLKGDVILNNFLFQLHLVLGMSYYKLFPTQHLLVKSGHLLEEQILFWKKLYLNGLGEFFIKNDINPKELLEFKNISSGPDIQSLTIVNSYIESSKNFIIGKSLLLWGGGKDSIVSHSILKNTDLDLFVFGKLDDIKKKTAEIAGKRVLLVKRTLSNKMLEMNKQGYYNGHVPITGMIAFSTFIVNYLYGYSHIILSNERSASEINTHWSGIDINHQYSKSAEFENDLQAYLKEYISQDIAYFSLLRGMYEYKIASIFAQQKDFFGEFSSCNRNFVIHNISSENENVAKKFWCGECEKCCFVFLILSPFLEEDELIKIFGYNLFTKKNLEKIFRELIGLENYKPFECVGTYDESLLSAKKAIHKYKNNLPIVLEALYGDVLALCDNEHEKHLEEKLLKLSDQHIIPGIFTTLLYEKE